MISEGSIGFVIYLLLNYFKLLLELPLPTIILLSTAES